MVVYLPLLRDGEVLSVIQIPHSAATRDLTRTVILL
jgi:hypothetical protein